MNCTQERKQLKMPTATENSIKSKTGMCMFEIYDGQAPVPKPVNGGGNLLDDKLPKQ